MDEQQNSQNDSVVETQSEPNGNLEMPPAMTKETAAQFSKNGDAFFRAVSLAAFGNLDRHGENVSIDLKGLQIAAKEPNNKLAKESLRKVKEVFANAHKF